MTPEARIAQLEAENARQPEQTATLVERVQELEARLTKDTHNEHIPDGTRHSETETSRERTRSACPNRRRHL